MRIIAALAICVLSSYTGTARSYWRAPWTDGLSGILRCRPISWTSYAEGGSIQLRLFLPILMGTCTSRIFLEPRKGLVYSLPTPWMGEHIVGGSAIFYSPVLIVYGERPSITAIGDTVTLACKTLRCRAMNTQVRGMAVS